MQIVDREDVTALCKVSRPRCILVALVIQYPIVYPMLAYPSAAPHLDLRIVYPSIHTMCIQTREPGQLPGARDTRIWKTRTLAAISLIPTFDRILGSEID
ncbi:hypothetical protein BO86DRAFT_35244 [Aspergillus japonicus CBS 114.51]|uniref:Uncharacterized protein n=1 Tax=Aspergillus japonicus CBS 114.51 TaxID=1448312 RepID=A0A8T8X756_ASPJA|nr:hypothetical protein BO86DRAFT_35244 [Aspergillus japonicus CBS 114.51]RAH83820.1 hypothetical protein BO86DRAFT_35244 [Aspergillus japonicus CBS 114.51]